MRTPIQKPEFRTWLAADGYPLRGRFWAPPGPPASHAIIYLHGIQSHGGWYEWSGSLLSRTGSAVVMPDRRGSGLNSESRGDVPHYRRWIEDLDDIVDCLAQEGFRTFDVVGVSWGGKLAAAWASQSPRPVRRILLVTPGIFPAVDLPLLQRLQVAAALLLHPQKQFPIPLSDAALFTNNPAGREFIARDPLKLSEVSAAFLWHSRRLDRLLIELPDGALRAPVTLLLAGQDRIIRNQPTQAWTARVAGAGLRQQLFENASHTLEFEPDPSAYEQILRAWCENKMQNSQQ